MNSEKFVLKVTFEKFQPTTDEDVGIKMHMNVSPDKMPPGIVEALASTLILSSGRRLGTERALERVSKLVLASKIHAQDGERGNAFSMSAAEMMEGFQWDDEEPPGESKWEGWQDV